MISKGVFQSTQSGSAIIPTASFIAGSDIEHFIALETLISKGHSVYLGINPLPPPPP